jgi:hypothetical protein
LLCFFFFFADLTVSQWLFVSGQKWHPDKCGAAGSSAGGGAEAAKVRFQKIQGAYAGN